MGIQPEGEWKNDMGSMDIIETEDIMKRWQENTEELYKKELHDPGNHKFVLCLWVYFEFANKFICIIFFSFYL